MSVQGEGFRRHGSGRGVMGGRGRGRPRGDNWRQGAGGQRGSLTAANRRKARKEKREMLAARREGDKPVRPPPLIAHPACGTAGSLCFYHTSIIHRILVRELLILGAELPTSRLRTVCDCSAVE